MFVTYKDFKNCEGIEFPKKSRMNYENYSIAIKNRVETGSSIYLFSSERKVVEGEQFWNKAAKLIQRDEKIEILKIKKKVIQKFLKRIEDEALFPGEIKLYNYKSKLLEKNKLIVLNSRKKDRSFVSRVLKRFEKISETKLLKKLLSRLMTILKEKGVVNERDQHLLNENILKELCGFDDENFRRALKYGIDQLCLQKQVNKGKVRIILVSEEIEKEKTEGKLENKKKIGRQIFRLIKKYGVENEREEIACNEELVRKEIKVKDKEYEKALEYCRVEGCVLKYQRKNKLYLLLLKEVFSEEFLPDVDELKKKVIKFIKTSEKETGEGYMYMTELKLLEVLNISEDELRKVVKNGLKDKLLKFDVIKGTKVVVFTQDRRLSINYIV